MDGIAQIFQMTKNKFNNTKLEYFLIGLRRFTIVTFVKSGKLSSQSPHPPWSRPW